MNLSKSLVYAIRIFQQLPRSIVREGIQKSVNPKVSRPIIRSPEVVKLISLKLRTSVSGNTRYFSVFAILGVALSFYADFYIMQLLACITLCACLYRLFG